MPGPSHLVMKFGVQPILSADNVGLDVGMHASFVAAVARTTRSLLFKSNRVVAPIASEFTADVPALPPLTRIVVLPESVATS